MARCISFDSYIKPQPSLIKIRMIVVVYLLIPTSNHNRLLSEIRCALVVYLLIPTSNHNSYGYAPRYAELYIF